MGCHLARAARRSSYGLRRDAAGTILPAAILQQRIPPVYQD